MTIGILLMMGEFQRIESNGSQPVGHDSFEGQMILSHAFPETIRKHRQLHYDSQQQQDRSYEKAGK